MLILPSATVYSLKRRGKKIVNASAGYEVVSLLPSLITNIIVRTKSAFKLADLAKTA